MNMSFRNGTEDCENIMSAINQGIDSHLEAVDATHRWDDTGRVHIDVNDATMPVLLRRLQEMDNDGAMMLADDIEEVWQRGDE